jgi:hypothetical protein
MISQQKGKLSQHKSLYLEETNPLPSIHDRGIKRVGMIRESLQTSTLLLLRGQPVIVMDNLHLPVPKMIYPNCVSRPL